MDVPRGQVMTDVEASNYLKSLVAQYISQGLSIREIGRRFDAYVEDARRTLQPGGVINPGTEQTINRLNQRIDDVLAQMFRYQGEAPLTGEQKLVRGLQANAGGAISNVEVDGLVLYRQLKDKIAQARTFDPSAGYAGMGMRELSAALSSGDMLEIRRALEERIFPTLNAPILVNYTEEGVRQKEFAVDDAISDAFPFFRKSPYNRKTMYIEERRFRAFLKEQLEIIAREKPLTPRDADDLYNRIALVLVNQNLLFDKLATAGDVIRIIREEIASAIARSNQ